MPMPLMTHPGDVGGHTSRGAWLATLALLASTACSSAPARPGAVNVVEAPTPAAAATSGEDPLACERTTVLTAIDADGQVDLGPFLPAMRAAFGDDLLVCASPARAPDEACQPLIDGVFGRAAVPHGFYLFHAEDFTLDVTVLVNASATASVSRTSCDPSLEELTSEASCEDRVHAMAERVSDALEPLTREHDELDRRMIHSTSGAVSVCQGLLLTHMIPREGVYADKIIFQHSLLSLHQNDSRGDTIALTALMRDVEGRSEVDDVLVYTANTMREVIGELDPATRSSSTVTVPPPGALVTE